MIAKRKLDQNLQNYLKKPKQKKSQKREQEKSKITVILLTHSHKRPLQFQTSKVKLQVGAAVCAVVIGFSCYNFISSAHLRQENVGKKQLESEMLQLEQLQQQVVTENNDLKQSSVQKDEQLQELMDISNQIQQELMELHEKERTVREHLGIKGEEENTLESSVRDSASKVIQTSSLSLGSSITQNPDLIKGRLLSVQMDIASQTADYDRYLETISSREFQAEQKRQAKAELRNQVVAYAKQFLGGRYVYGQNDPHTGVDCSGFSRYVLKQKAGVYLSRTSVAQSNQGTTVSIDEARPGDLVFYGDGTTVNHVAIYIGNRQVIHASNEKNGIIISRWNYRTPIRIKNVIGN